MLSQFTETVPHSNPGRQVGDMHNDRFGLGSAGLLARINPDPLCIVEETPVPLALPSCAKMTDQRPPFWLKVVGRF